MNRHFLIDSYQKKKIRRRRLFRLRYLLLALIVYAAWHFLFPGNEPGKDQTATASQTAARAAGPATPAVAPGPRPLPLTKQDLASIDPELIRTRNLTIDWGLQQYIMDMAARYKLYYGSIAVIDAHTGDILALYGQTPAGQDCSLGLDTEVAASIFKVVTAVAAMEQAGFTSQSTFFYTGNAHTLYKNQLTNKRNRWCADISLADAFARSNNIVFAKLGTIYLGQTPIFLTAKRMGFWKQPLRELKSDPSTSFLPKDDYNLAELACGFNKQTRISPVHAAQMVTAVLNSGSMITPRIVKTQQSERIQVMRSSTADELGAMMEKTVRSGTVSRTFRGISRDRVMKTLAIGGKSGSIDGNEPAGRRNWFVGYAQDRTSNQGIAVGCCLILKDHFWIEADMFTRLVMRYYFSHQVQTARNAPEAQKLTAAGFRDLGRQR